jgi:predicted DNA-binding transcriptional regulator AlpA
MTNKQIEQIGSPYELAGYDRLMFDDELSTIDRMGRSTRREAIKKRGYPKPRRVGLRSAWLYSEIITWVRAQPAGERPATPRKALSEGVKRLRAKHGQRVAEGAEVA